MNKRGFTIYEPIRKLFLGDIFQIFEEILYAKGAKKMGESGRKNLRIGSSK
jgi:hypothetical protein